MSGNPLINIEIEQALFGALFVDRSVAGRVSGIIEPGHFSEVLHQRIWQASIDVEKRGIAPNALTVKCELPADIQIDEKTSLPEYLARLQASSAGSLVAEDMARHVVELHQRRQAVAAALQMATTIQDGADIAKEIHEGIERLSAVRDAATRDDGVRILSSGEFVAGFTPPDYLVYGIIQRRYIYSLTGQTGAGKTAVALLLAHCVDTGMPFGGTEVSKGKVLYFAGENPVDVQMRWLLMAEKSSFDLTKSNVHFIPGIYKISEILETVRHQIEKLGGLDLIIIDTSAAYYEGDEDNSNTDQGDHARRLRRLTTFLGGPAVLVLCHPVKNAGPDNLSPRGGGAFVNEMDGNFTNAKKDEVIEVHWQVKLRGPDFSPLKFRLVSATASVLKDSQGRSIPSVMAVAISETEQAAAAQNSHSNRDRLLVAMLNNPAGSLALLAVGSDFTLSKGDPDKKKVSRVASKLMSMKLVKKVGKTWHLTTAGAIEARRLREVQNGRGAAATLAA